MGRNVRTRKAARVAAKLAAWGVYDPEARSWRRPPASRCTGGYARGCRLGTHHGNHRDIRGREWRQAPVRP